MRKISLDVDQLTVESFTTTVNDGARRGTVRGLDSGASGIGCGTQGCASYSDLEICICENKKRTTEWTACHCE